MTETAHDYQTIETASTEGLEDLFEAKHRSAQSSTSQSSSVEEAALLYEVSPRTIIRRLQKGNLPGFKVQGKFGGFGHHEGQVRGAAVTEQFLG